MMIPKKIQFLYDEIACEIDNSPFEYCALSDKHFAEIFGVGAPTIARWIKKLEEAGLILIKHEYGDLGKKERRIHKNEK